MVGQPTGFIYVVPSVGRDYLQPSLQQVPTWFEGRIYFGPCKIPMRPRMEEGDYIFGISPSSTRPRRMLFAARIAQKMTYAEAYRRFPKMRGPVGPIHVRPARAPGLAFPESHYEHIPGANHPGDWRNDIRTPELDVFFVCEPAIGSVGQWLGKAGSILTPAIMEFLRKCLVHGVGGLLGPNSWATDTAPVAHGRLYRGLHLETPYPENFLEMVCRSSTTNDDAVPLSPPTQGAAEMATPVIAGRSRSSCGGGKANVQSVLLVRVGADQTEGGGHWNAPIDPESGQFVYVPIPESKPLRDGFARPYSMLVPALANLGQSLPAHLSDRTMHLDPDFEFLTYGDRGAKGRQLASTLGRGDLIVFYSGLRAIGNSGQLVYAIIGLLTVDRIDLASEQPKSVWHQNAHTRRELSSDADDIIVVGAKRYSGRLSRAIPIGEYRVGAYRVTEPLLRFWGGLSARDGFLQRSGVFPALLEPKKFIRWWATQNVELVAENNPV
jgi:hypothetical protein